MRRIALSKTKQITRPAETLGERIRQARERAKLSKADTARAAGIGWDALHKIEGDQREPTAGTLAAICRAVHASADELLGLP